MQRHWSVAVVVLLLGVAPTTAHGAGGQNCVCNAARPTCNQLATSGADTCGFPCTKTFANTCNASAPACGQTTSGTYLCGGTCSKTGPSCEWKPYGFGLPGDPVYGFSAVQNPDGTPVYADPKTRDLVGFSAKGNIIVGDYTSAAFQNSVVPRLQPGPGSITQPYVVDSTDADLGYHDAGFDSFGRPKFTGNYNQVDQLGSGTKLDGSPRKFYESSLSDREFQALVDPKLLDGKATVEINGILFTNHAFAGFSNAQILSFNGSLVARDDALIFNHELRITHDIRLLDPSARALNLPFAIKRPKVVQWQECRPSGCS